MRPTVGKMIGSSGSRFWGQVHDFVPEEPQKALTKGRMIAALGIDTGGEADQVEVVKVGREILGRLHELYFGQEEEKPMEALRSAIEKLTEEFGQVDVAVLVIAGRFGYIGGGGKAGVWIKTEDKQGFLIQGQQREAGVQVLSGKIRPGMVVLLGNGIFWQGPAVDSLGSIATAAGRDMDEAVELLTEKSGGDAPGAVAALVYITAEEVQEEAEEGTPTEEKAAAEPEIRPQPMINRNNKLWQKWSGWWGRIYLRRGDREAQRKKMRYIGVGLLAALMLMVGVGQLINTKRVNNNSLRNEAIEKLAADFKDASGMVDLNPAKSKQTLLAIKDQLETYKGEKKPDPRITEILANWDGVWTKALGIVRAEQTELIDLNLVREGMTAGALTWADDKLYALDVQGNRVVEVDTDNGSGKVVGGGQSLTGARLIAGYPGKVMVVSETGMVEMGVAEPRIKADEITARVKGIELFGGNVYALDADGGEIWRYAAKGETFAAGQKWLADDEDREGIKTGTDLAIDGSIWVVKSGGIVKFTRGVGEGFEIQDLDQPWGQGAKIYTDEESEKLYILDPANARVVVVGKDGKYVKQYTNQAWTQAKDLIVNEKRGKIFLPMDGKVWMTGL